jgi:hypothetical protein
MITAESVRILKGAVAFNAVAAVVSAVTLVFMSITVALYPSTTNRAVGEHGFLLTCCSASCLLVDAFRGSEILFRSGQA